ncbi:class I SAM-dependent methyltransferase [Candidatus Woesearchaeota archaeon]|nr:class I SAM-dependent methyltransferase [Candidatus Woesearchaeota archaeon]
MTSSLRKYVLTEKNKNVDELERAGLEWLHVATKNKLDYEIDWLGVPIIQSPEDIVLMQELIYDLKPDVIIDIGIAHGGSLVYYASLLELIGKGEVIGVDIDIREHNREVLEDHPLFKRIKLLQGDSSSPDMFSKVKALIPDDASVLLCLDSNHTKNHVLNELRLYHSLIKVGGYIVIFDTATSKLAEMGSCEKMYIKNGPKEGVEVFLKENDSFVIDKKFNKLVVGTSPDGYLKRIK